MKVEVTSISYYLPRPVALDHLRSISKGVTGKRHRIVAIVDLNKGNEVIYLSTETILAIRPSKFRDEWTCMTSV